jgi:tetratricopeptide (TPR) repeat protein
VAPITRICSVFALTVVLSHAIPVSAKGNNRSALNHYVQARMADEAGDSVLSAAAFGAALTAEPGNQLVAIRAYRQAIEAGDKALAVRAALQLERSGLLPVDARLLLFSERLTGGDFRGARLMLDRIEDEGSLSFLVPILASWTNIAARSSQPLAPLDGLKPGSLTSTYANEHRAFIMMAQGDRVEAVTLIKSLATTDGRLASLRISAAALLLKAKDREGAFAMLEGNAVALRAARSLVLSGKALPAAIDNAPAGIAQLYARIAADLLGDRVPLFGFTMARFARFLDPKNDYVAMVEVNALAANRLDRAGLAALDKMAVQSPFGNANADTRIALLERLNRGADAVSFARMRAEDKGAIAVDHLRLGDLLVRQGDDRGAAIAFGQAIAASQSISTDDDPVPWMLWLLQGGALERSGDWENGREALKKAVAGAPGEAVPLNHLGYAMLERGENLREATALIARASALKPDDAAITDSFGWALFLGGQTDKAVETLERAVATDPLEPTLSEHLGDAYWTVGRHVDARYAWRAARLQAEGRAADRLIDKIDIGLKPTTAAR